MTQYKKLIASKKELKIIDTNVFKIPERLKEYDNSLFVVYNNLTKMFEIHSADNKTYDETLCMTTKSLDFRILKKIKSNDTKRHGKKIIDNLKRHNKNNEENKSFKNKHSALLLGHTMHQYILNIAEEDNV